MDATIGNAGARPQARHTSGAGNGPTKIAELLTLNRRAARHHTPGSERAEPTRQVAVVTCMDARIDPIAMLGLAEGEVHVLRNAGGIVTDDVIRSLIISQHRLGTEAVAVIQHAGCGLLALEDEEFADEVERACGIRPPFSALGFSDTEASVCKSVARVRRSPYLLHHDEVRGFILNLSTGLLEEVECSFPGG